MIGDLVSDSHSQERTLRLIAVQLQMLKEQMSHSQGEHLEWIVIILIAAEILVAVINVVVDLLAAT